LHQGCPVGLKIQIDGFIAGRKKPPDDIAPFRPLFFYGKAPFIGRAAHKAGVKLSYPLVITFF